MMWIPETGLRQDPIGGDELDAHTGQNDGDTGNGIETLPESP
jgi:hypothetical protein